MATITSTASGNWNDPTKWDLERAPVAGGSDDVVIANTHTIALDGARACLNLTVDSGGHLDCNSAEGDPNSLLVYNDIHVNGAAGIKNLGAIANGLITVGKTVSLGATGTITGAVVMSNRITVDNLPSVGNVLAGVDRGDVNLGILTLPDAGKTLNTESFGNPGTPTAGTYRPVTAANVKLGVSFGASDSETGTLATGGRGGMGLGL